MLFAVLCASVFAFGASDAFEIVSRSTPVENRASGLSGLLNLESSNQDSANEPVNSEFAEFGSAKPDSVRLIDNSVLEKKSSAVEVTHRYEVSARLDVPLALGISLMAALGVYQYYSMESVGTDNLKPKSELLPWDRPFAGRYSGWATTVSHYSGALAVAPLVLAGFSLYHGDADAHDFGAFTLMFVEAFILQNALNQIFRSTELWPRPFMYAKNGKGAEKAADAHAEAYGSFYSGHASAAFTVAVFTGEWFSEIYPNSKYKTLVWASSFSIAALVGALRVVAGKHYPTDVILGSFMGAGVSFGVLKLHEFCKKKIAFWAIPGNIGSIVFF